MSDEVKLLKRAVGNVSGETISIVLLEDYDETFLGRPRVFYRVKVTSVEVSNGARHIGQVKVKFKRRDQAEERFAECVLVAGLRGSEETFA